MSTQIVEALQTTRWQHVNDIDASLAGSALLRSVEEGSDRGVSIHFPFGSAPEVHVSRAMPDAVSSLLYDAYRNAVEKNVTFASEASDEIFRFEAATSGNVVMRQHLVGSEIVAQMVGSGSLECVALTMSQAEQESRIEDFLGTTLVPAKEGEGRYNNIAIRFRRPSRQDGRALTLLSGGQHSDLFVAKAAIVIDKTRAEAVQQLRGWQGQGVSSDSKVQKQHLFTERDSAQLTSRRRLISGSLWTKVLEQFNEEAANASDDTDAFVAELESDYRQNVDPYLVQQATAAAENAISTILNEDIRIALEEAARNALVEEAHRQATINLEVARLHAKPTNQIITTQNIFGKPSSMVPNLLTDVQFSAMQERADALDMRLHAFDSETGIRMHQMGRFLLTTMPSDEFSAYRWMRVDKVSNPDDTSQWLDELKNAHGYIVE